MATKKYETIQRYRKVIIVGHSLCGKRALLFAFEHKQYVGSDCPTIFDTPVIPVQIDGKTIHIAIFNTSGHEDYDRLRPLLYPDTNVVLICYSVDNPVSALGVTEKWAPEIRRYCDRCPIILVACKIDLRTDAKTLAQMKKFGDKPVTRKVGRQIAARIKADAYVECSSKTGEGIQDLFIQAARLSIRKTFRHPVTCQCILQ